MYIIKNAFRCISRSKGRNILIGVIVLVIAISACIGLSIRQAAESAKTEILEGLSVTATISYDRQSLIGNMRDQKTADSNGKNEKFDKNQFSSMMGETNSLTLDEYKKYASADSVKDFYYSMTVMINGSEDFKPVSTDISTETGSGTQTDASTNEENNSDRRGLSDQFGGNQGGMMRMGFSASDFQLIGYSSESAMTSFLDGNASVTEGVIFKEGTDSYDCIISEELAAFNDIEVGDTFEMTNPNNEAEIYTLTVVGIYTNSSTNEQNMFSMGGMTSSDPANEIYVSYTALQKITEASEAASVTVTNETTGEESKSVMKGSLSATYVFSDTDAYYLFEEEVKALGLDDSYTVYSSDLQSYEDSLTPLNTLSEMAGWFLLVILIIGAIILVVLNIFNVRERKYEIGVLTAMGMKKGKVALQFLTEIFAVTMIAVLIGAGTGAIFSVPVTNALLENQVASKNSQTSQIEQSFGRGNMNMDDMPSNAPTDMNGGNTGGQNPFTNMFDGSFENNYVTEISSAMNVTVVIQMLGIAVLLTLVAGAVSMLFVMRYEPLKILANRD